MQVDFYILKTKTRPHAWEFACDLIEKWATTEKIFVLTDTLQDAEQFDQLLWTFREESFIPHQLQTEATAKGFDVAIVIGTEAPEHPVARILNLSTKTLDVHHQHLIEIVYNDAVIENKARERYKFYRDKQYQLQTFKM